MGWQNKQIVLRGSHTSGQKANDRLCPDALAIGVKPLVHGAGAKAGKRWAL